LSISRLTIAEHFRAALCQHRSFCLPGAASSVVHRGSQTAFGTMFDRPRGGVPLRCRILVVGVFGATKPTLSHAGPGGTLFEVRRVFGNSKTFVRVSAKFCRWVHGALARSIKANPG
jgi:hypothetical protein